MWGIDQAMSKAAMADSGGPGSRVAEVVPAVGQGARVRPISRSAYAENVPGSGDSGERAAVDGQEQGGNAEGFDQRRPGGKRP
jgi:hypothetical protein